MNKPKFKPGDKVVVLDGGKIKYYCGTWNPAMAFHVGKRCTVESVVEPGHPWGSYGYRLVEIGFLWDERGLLPVREEITITRKGQKVIAKSRATGKTAEARCNLEDTFDFGIGAKLALDRLIGTQTPAERDLKIGDIVVGNEKADAYLFTRCGWRGVVTEIVGDGRFRARSLTGSYDDAFTLDLEYFDVVGSVIGNLQNAGALSDEMLFESVKGLIGKDAICRLFKYAFKYYDCNLQTEDIRLVLGDKRRGKDD